MSCLPLDFVKLLEVFWGHLHLLLTSCTCNIKAMGKVDENVDECVSQHGTLFGLKKFEIFHAYRYPRFEVFQRQQNVFQKFSPCIQRSIQFKIEIFVAT